MENQRSANAVMVRVEAVADGLQLGGVVGGGEPVGQLGEPDPGVSGLALGPLVPVDPDLGGVGEIRADFDERRAELLVPEVEVEARHTAVGLDEGVPRRPGRALAFDTDEHRSELLGHPDRGDPRPPGRGLRGQVGAHPVDLAVVLGEPHHRDALVDGEPVDRLTERGPHLVEDRRRRDRIAQVRGQEGDDLPADLQIGHVGVEVNPVQALQVQRDLPIENLVDRHRCGHARQPGLIQPLRPASSCRGGAAML